MEYIVSLHVGLDIGIASVGWCVIDSDAQHIAGIGVRVFTKAENPKTGASLAAPRRLYRSTRRRNRRRRERMARLRNMFTTSGMLTPEEFEDAFVVKSGDPTPYELRVAGLDRKLTEREWARVLTQMCKRRGYKSMRLNGDEDDDEGVVKEAIAENESLMKEKGYRTIGEMLLRDEKFAESKRNRSDYRGVVSRELLLDEIRTLFVAQRKYGNQYATENIESEYIDILSMQAPITEGEDLMALVGRCSIDKQNPRIPLACPTFERFRIVDKLHNVRYTLEDGGIRHSLTDEQRQAVVDKAFGRATTLTLADVRKICDLPENARFIGVRYDTRDPDDISAEKKEKLPHPKRWHEMRKAVESISPETWKSLASDIDTLDEIAIVLTYYKLPESVDRELAALGLEENVRETLGELRFSKNGHLSRETLLKILPHMESGLSYSEACKAAGLDHSASPEDEKQAKLPPIPPDDVRNPVVLRALTQTRKVVNAIIDEFGSIEELHIEMARDVGKAYEDRRKIEKRQKENRAVNESAIESLRELGLSDPKGHDIVKYKLWKEQGGHCVYSGVYIDSKRMLDEPGYAEVDHILPHGRSFDDSYMNKVLVTATENQRKRGRTPFEYMGEDKDRWHEFEERVISMHLPHPKRDRLLRKNFDNRAEDEFKDRNLNDTRYIARYFKNFVEANLDFSGKNKRPVVTVNGRATAYLRKAWRLQKIREDGDLHHALDAAVVAATSRGMIQKVSRFFSIRPLRNTNGTYVDADTGEIIEARYVPEPWNGFREELVEILAETLPEDPLDVLLDPNRPPAPILVSRMPARSIRGEVHKETIRRIESESDDGKILTSKRVLLKDLTPALLERMVGKKRDRELYLALKERLDAHDGDGSKAFTEPFYKPSKPGRTAPRVRGIRVYDNPASGGTYVRGGLADNSKIVRTDVFEKGGKYYLVPVYLKDVAQGRLPSRAITAGKGEKLWREMNDTYRFKFSLYPNDLVRLVKGSSGDPETYFGYFVATSRSTASITLRAHDSSWERPSLGVARNVIAFDKLHVDVLGRIVRPIRQEKRIGFSNSRGRK